MSDYNSSLPVRTENNGDVAAKIVDGTITSQALAVDASGKITSKLNDAAGNGITSITNGSNQALSTSDQANGPVTPGTVAGFSELIGGQFNTTLPTLTNGQQAAIQVDNRGRLLVDTSNADDHNYGTVGANTLRTAAQIGNATGAADFNFGAVGAQTLRVAAEVSNASGLLDDNYGVVGAQTLRSASQIGNATGAANFDNGTTGAQTLRVAANLAVGGANVSNTNPVPVTIDTTPGTSVNNFKQATAIAAGASDNHDYTVTAGKTLFLDQIEASASGKAKITMQVETGVATGSFTSYFVQFNSTATPNMSIHLDNAIQVAAGVRVRVIVLNDDKAAMDLYSTISGYEI